jgi:hypothetical protein
MGTAGLWETWRSPAGERVRSFAIITTEPNELCAALHNRMPAILAPQAWPEWLGEQPADEARLKSLLAPYPFDAMICWPASATSGTTIASSNRSRRRKRPVCRGKYINLDDHWEVLLDSVWTNEFFSLARLRENPGPPLPGFSFPNAARHAARYRPSLP